MGNKSSNEGMIEELMKVPSIGELTARVLIENGFDSISKLESADKDDLVKIDEIGEDKAVNILEEIGEEREGSKEVSSEIFCVTCRTIVDIDKDDTCKECGEDFRIEGTVILPGKGVIDDPKKSLAEFEKELLDGKESPDVWYGRGAVLDSMGFKWEALKSYNKVIEHDPLYDHIWNAKARAALDVGQVRDAARAYKVAFDTHVANSKIKGLSTKEPSIKKEKKKIKKREVSVKEVENKLFMARSVIHELKGNDIDLSKLNNLLERSVEARNNDRRKESVEKSKDIIHLAEQVREFVDIKNKIEEKLDILEEYDLDISEFVETKDSLIEKMNNGQYEKSLDSSYDLLDEIEERLKEEKAKAADKKEKEEKLSDGIQEIRDMMKKLRATSLNIEKFKDSFSEIVKAKKEERYQEGLEKLDDLLETGSTIIETDKKINELKDKVKESEFKLEDFGFKEDIEKILDLARDGVYHEAYEEISDILRSFEERLNELEIQKELKDEFSKKVEELKEKFSDLKDTSVDTNLIKSMISDAKELKSEEEYEEGINVLDDAIYNAEKLLEFSEDLEEAKSLLKKMNSLNIDFEPYKERLKETKNEAEEGNLADIFENIDELTQEIGSTIDETISERKQELKYEIDELGEIIEDGENKDISMEFFDTKVGKAQEAMGQEEYYKGLRILEGEIEKAEMKVQLDPMLSSIDELVDEIEQQIDVTDFENKKLEIEKEFEDGNYEESIRKANDLHEEIIQKKDELERKQELEEKYEEKLSVAKEKLSAGRDTKVNVDDVKKMINQAVQAQKDNDYDKALEKLDDAIETGDRVLRIFDMIKEGAEKVKKLKQYDLEFEEYMEHLKDCKKMADINIYDKAEMILEDALDEMDEELIEIGEETLEEIAEESKDEIEAMEEELSRSYEKLRQDVEDLKDLYLVADDFDIQVGIGRKLLKMTIKNIREGDYKKATKHLEKGEDKILESIEKRITDMINHVESLLDRVEDEEKIEDAENILDDVEDSRENGDYREALEGLVEVREMLKDIKEIDIDEKISSIEELVDDAEEADLEVNNSKELISELREIEEAKEDNIEEEIKSTEKKIREIINVEIKNRIERSRDELDDMGVDESKISKPANLLTEASLAQEEGDLKRSISLIEDYQEMLEEGLEDSED